MASFPERIGKFRLTERTGKGGFGEVFLATDTVLRRDVVIKLMLDELQDEKDRERFEREAQSAAGLDHPNVVTIHDFDEFEGRPYIVMQYVEGQTLADLIKKEAALPPDQRLHLARKIQLIEQLCNGLAHAHDRGIVHRDIKPQNLMVDVAWNLKVLDFGIVKLASSHSVSMGIIGTPSYMSPEQISGRSLDNRSDIFSVGSVFYELLCGQKAFPGKSHDWLQVAWKITNEAPRPIRELCPELSTDVAEVVNRCLAKEPEARYRQLGALYDDLERIRSKLPAVAPPLDADDETKSLLDIVEEFLHAGKLVQAGELLKRAQQAEGGPSKTLKSLKVQRRWQAAVAEAADEAIEAAQTRFEAGDHDTAIEQLSKFEPEHDLIREAATGLEARKKWIEGRLAAAQVALDELRPAEALGILEALRQKEPGAPGLSPLLKRALHDEQARQLDVNQRQAQIAAWVVEAQALLARHDLRTAAARVTQALELDPANEPAQALRTTIEQGLETLEWERQAEIVAESARREFDVGRHDEALARLEAFRPAHTVVSAVRGALIERRGGIDDQLAAAREDIDAGRVDEALGRLERLERREPATPGLASLLDETRRRSQLATLVSSAAADLQRTDLADALAKVDEALRHDPAHNPALELKAAIEERQRRLSDVQRAETAVDRALLDFDAGLWSEALAALEGFDPPLEAVTQALEALRARRKTSQDEVAVAREALGAGQFEKAAHRLERLERREPAMPGLKSLLDETRRQSRLAALVASAAADLNRQDLFGAVTGVDEALRLDPLHEPALALRMALEERQHRLADDQRAGAVMDRARRDFDAGLSAEAIRALERFDLTHDAVAQELTGLRARRQWIDERLAEARDALDAEDHAGAIRCLDELERREPNEPALAELLLRARRLEKLTRLVTEASEARQQDDLARATTLAIEALQLDPGFEPAATLRGEILEEVERRAGVLAAAARQEFAEGRSKSALASLEGFRPRHEIVTTELETLRSRTAWVERQLTAADSAQTADRPADALALLEEVADREPAAPGLAGRLARVRRRDQVLTLLTLARQSLESGDIAAGLARADQALELDLSAEDVRAFRDTVERRFRQVERRARRRRTYERALAVLRRTVTDRRLQTVAAVTTVAVVIWTQVPFGPTDTTSTRDTAELSARAQASPASSELGPAGDVGLAVPVVTASDPAVDTHPLSAPGDTLEPGTGDPAGPTAVETSASEPVDEPIGVNLSPASAAVDSATDLPSSTPTTEPVPVDREPAESSESDTARAAAESDAAPPLDTDLGPGVVDASPDPEPAAPPTNPAGTELDTGVTAADPDAAAPVDTTPEPDPVDPAPDPGPVPPPADPAAAAISAAEAVNRASLLEEQVSELQEQLTDWYRQPEASGLRDIWPAAPSSVIETQNAMRDQMRSQEVEFLRCSPSGLGPERERYICFVMLTFRTRAGNVPIDEGESWTFDFRLDDRGVGAVELQYGRSVKMSRPPRRRGLAVKLRLNPSRRRSLPSTAVFLESPATPGLDISAA